MAEVHVLKQPDITIAMTDFRRALTAVKIILDRELQYAEAIRLLDVWVEAAVLNEDERAAVLQFLGAFS